MSRITRSKAVKLSMMGKDPTVRIKAVMLNASIVAIIATGCTEEKKVETGLFSTVGQCEKHYINRERPDMAAKCIDAMSQAKAQHAEVAPKYTTLSACEEQHGNGKCGEPPEEQPRESSVSSSFFMPLMLGYMMGGGFRNPAKGFASQPLYPTKNGGYSTGGTRPTYVGKKLGGSMSVRSSRWQSPSRSTVQSTRAVTANRGGFGRSSISFGG